MWLLPVLMFELTDDAMEMRTQYNADITLIPTEWWIAQLTDDMCNLKYGLKWKCLIYLFKPDDGFIHMCQYIGSPLVQLMACHMLAKYQIMIWSNFDVLHYDDVTMSLMASQITSLTIVYWTVYSGADQRKPQSSASLAFVRGIHRGPVNSPHKRPVTRKMFPFDDVIMMSWNPFHSEVRAEYNNDKMVNSYIVIQLISIGSK